LLVQELKDNEIKIEVSGNPSLVEDGFFYIHLDSVYVSEGFEGDILLDFDAPSGSGFDDGSIVVGRILRGEVDIEVTNVETFGDGGGTVTIMLEENRAGALKDSPESIVLVLPKGFKWGNSVDGLPVGYAVYSQDTGGTAFAPIDSTLPEGCSFTDYQFKCIYGDETLSATIAIGDDDSGDKDYLSVSEVEKNLRGAVYSIEGFNFKVDRIDYTRSRDWIDVELVATEAGAEDLSDDEFERDLKIISDDIAAAFIDDAGLYPEFIEIEVYSDDGRSIYDFEFEFEYDFPRISTPEELSIIVDGSSKTATCLDFTVPIVIADRDRALKVDEVIAEISGKSNVTLKEITVGRYKPYQWDFNDGNTPEGFSFVVLDHGVPANSARFPNNEAFVVCNTESPDETGNWSRRYFSLCGTSWFEPAGVANRWVKTPPVTLAEKASLSWDARSNEANFLEDYNVLISTSGNDPQDFTMLMKVKGETYDWIIHDVDLSEYAGKTVYLAFQLVTDDGAYLWLDNIEVKFGESIKAPLISTLGAESVSANAATLKGVVSPGSEKIIEKGFECKTTVSEEFTAYPVTDSSFTFRMTNLKANTEYTFRPYATTSTGTYYGMEKRFTTMSSGDSPGTGGDSGGSGSSGGGGGGGGVSSGTSVDSSGGIVKAEGAEVKIPEGAINKRITVVIKKTDSSNVTIPSNYKLVGPVYNITMTKSDNFKKEVTITLPFDKSKVDAEKDELAIFWWDGENWVILNDIQVNWQEGKVSGKINHFTKFAVLSTPKTKGILEGTTDPHSSSISLNDIAGHWAENYIRKLVDAGAINGYADCSFRPNMPITRAEFAKVLVRAFNIPSGNGKVFKDSKGHWAEEAIGAAFEAGIITGYNEERFGPDDLITREQIAAMAVKAAGLSKTETQMGFSDSGKISIWAKESVAAAFANGLITGYNDNSFRPLDNASRAEAVTIIVRALDLR